jgi:small subunit ribosomal protein S6
LNLYELIILIHPDQSDNAVNMVNRYKEMITKAEGKIHRHEDWGRKSLAYGIKNLHKAHFVLINFELNPKDLKELTDALRYNDAVLRFMTTETKQAITKPSVMMQPRKPTEHQGDRA